MYHTDNRQTLKEIEWERLKSNPLIFVTENIIISIRVSGELLQIPRAEHPLHATQKHKLNVLLLLKRLLFQSVSTGIAGGTTAASIHAVRHIYSLSSGRTKCK